MQDYIGKELELFKHAHNWKTYYAKFFKHFLINDVLEVGAGIGSTTQVLCDGKQNSWICIEPDSAQANEILMKKEQGELPSIIEVKKNTLKEIETNKKFDAIIYIDVIEHIENDSEEIDRASSFLKPNGYLVVLVPAHNFLFSPFDRFIGHLRRYNKQTLHNIIPKNFQKIDLRYLDSLGVFASLLNKWLLKQSYPKLTQIKFWDKFIIPVSKITDRILLFSMGKSVLGIWQKQ